MLYIYDSYMYLVHTACIANHYSLCMTPYYFSDLAQNGLIQGIEYWWTLIF